MKTGQGFLLVFSITSPSSLSELASLREEIIRIKDDENIPMVIVGNKADLEDSRSVPRAKGFSISQRWGAPYYESSARTRSTFPPSLSKLWTSVVALYPFSNHNLLSSKRGWSIYRPLSANAAQRRRLPCQQWPRRRLQVWSHHRRPKTKTATPIQRWSPKMCHSMT